jgi:predicted permease
VIGVMDSVGAFPPRSEASFLLPLGGPGVGRPDTPLQEALIVLRPGVGLAALQAAASASADRNAAADREAWRAHVAAAGGTYVPPDEPVRIEAWPYRGPPFHSDEVWAAFLLAGLGAVVLLVAALNVASLALARSTAAERDLAVRSALGATRVRLALGIVSEVTTAVLLGGLIGAGIAAPVASELRASAGPDFSVLFPAVDVRILAVAMGFTLLAGFSAAAWPAWRVFRSDLQSSLQRGRASWAGAPGAGGLRRIVTAEIAVSTLLCAVAMFFVAALGRHERLDRGFRTDGVVYARVSTPEGATAEERALALGSALEAARGLPGVRSAAVGSVPVSTSVTLSTRQVATGGGADVPGYHWIGPVLGDYLGTLGIGLLAGRAITPGEARQGAAVAVVSRSLAERLRPGGDALGAQLFVGETEEGRVAVEVVGITADLALPSGLPMGHVFLPYALRPEAQASLVLRVEGDESSALEGLRALVSAAGVELTLVEATTLAFGVRESARIQAFLGAMVGVLAGMTLLLAAAGTYGVLAYTTRCRTHELGIRLALGSSPARLLRLVLLEAVQPIGAGALVGLLGAMLAAAGMSSMLLGVRSTDPRVLGVTTVAIVVVGLISVLPSSLGAARTDPAIPLRSD